ncbi:unnamed protein product [Prunus armeniaca]
MPLGGYCSAPALTSSQPAGWSSGQPPPGLAQVCGPHCLPWQLIVAGNHILGLPPPTLPLGPLVEVL